MKMSHLDTIESVLQGDNEITPQKLAIMKLRPSEYDHDLFSEPDTSSRRKSSLNAHSQNNALARSTRQVSTTSRHANAFLSSHRSKMSMELTTQAENKFLSLMELMSNASHEASSLKEYWSRLITDRQSYDREMEELRVEVSEYREEIERKESEHQSHHHELAEKKMQIDKLLVELSTALNIIKELKKKAGDRDGDLKDSHKQLADLRQSFSRLQTEHNTFKSESERKISKTTTTEAERDRAKEEAEKHLREYRSMYRECTELREKFSHTSSLLESSRKEVLSLKERIRSCEHERSSGWSERDRLQEELRIVKAKSEEYLNEYSEVTERFEHLQRESKKTKESLRSAESQCDEYTSTVERLRHEIKHTKERLNDSESRYTDVLVNFEHSKRDCNGKDERISSLESELSELRQSFEAKVEEYRLVMIERDQFRYDLENERGGGNDKGHRVTTLEETIERSESSLTEVRSELHRTTERMCEIERERDEARHHHGHLNTELTQLKERLVLLQTELKTTIDARDYALKDVAKFKSRYEEEVQTRTEWHSSTEEFEVEIENLRFMLSEAREQKERAIAARQSADRERDEFVAKYEDKCRQLERFDESKSGHVYSSHGRSGGRSLSTRLFKGSSSTTQNSRHEELNGQHGSLNATSEVH